MTTDTVRPAVRSTGKRVRFMVNRGARRRPQISKRGARRDISERHNPGDRLHGMKLAAWGALALSSLGGGRAFAQNSLGVHFSVFAESTTVLAPVFDGRIRLARRLSLELMLPMAAVETPDDDGMVVRLANPYAGLAWFFVIDAADISLGAGIALPVARVPGDGDTAPARVTFLSASNSRGRYNQWLWEPEAMSVVAPATIQVDLGLLGVRADAAWALMMPTGGESVETIVQFGGEGFVDLGLVSVGARVQNVWQPTAEDETSQVSVGPLAELDASPVILRSSFMLNIEGPAGSSFSDDGFWSFQLGGSIFF